MAPSRVFLDTSCLIALARRRDSLHEAAVATMRELADSRTPFTTSEWVLAEFLSGAAHPSLRARGVSMVQQLRNSPSVVTAGFLRGL
jgi:predicted nucleic acid-binding protein